MIDERILWEILGRVGNNWLDREVAEGFFEEVRERLNGKSLSIPPHWITTVESAACAMVMSKPNDDLMQIAKEMKEWGK